MDRLTLPTSLLLSWACATSASAQVVAMTPDRVNTDGRAEVVLTITPPPTEEPRKLTNTRRVTVGGVNAAFFAPGDAGRLSFVAPPQTSGGDRDVRVFGDSALELAAGRLAYVESATTSGLLGIAGVVGWIVGLVVAGFAVVIMILILLGRIKLDGLLNDEEGKPSLARFQFLVFTFVIALGLFIIVLNSNPPGFPDIPNGILILLGLSGTGFLASKGIDAFRATREGRE